MTETLSAQLLDVLPFVLGLGAACVVLARLWRRLPDHGRPGEAPSFARDARGVAASLDMVLTLPILMVILLIIVQLAVLLHAQLIVSYAAYAACRSAIVWLPSDADEEDKQRHVEAAAALACLPIATRVSLVELAAAGVAGAAGGGSLGHGALALTGSPLAMYSETLLSIPDEDGAIDAWSERMAAALEEVLPLSAFMAARSAVNPDIAAPSAGNLSAGNFGETRADAGDLAARRAFGTMRKYAHARACTVATWSEAGEQGPLEVVVHHQLTLTVPWVGLFFDDDPGYWIQESSAGGAFGALFPSRRRDTLLPIGVARPFIRTLSSRCTLVRQGKVKGEGCE